MFNKEFNLHIVRYNKQIFSGLVIKVKISSEIGEMEILFGHSPLIALIKPGPLLIVDKKMNKKFINISESILEIQQKTVIILTN
ncbi:MAG: F0F1 ATP synthase subunit epsilon [Enterobacterales bacterium]